MKNKREIWKNLAFSLKLTILDDCGMQNGFITIWVTP